VARYETGGRAVRAAQAARTTQVSGNGKPFKLLAASQAVIIPFGRSTEGKFEKVGGAQVVVVFNFLPLQRRQSLKSQAETQASRQILRLLGLDPRSDFKPSAL